MAQKVSIFWFRRDLRLEDNHGLYRALNSGTRIMPIFIFDPEILDELPKDDARVNFIMQNLQQMRDHLQAKHGSSLAIYHGKPEDVFGELIKEWDVQEVFANRDYEPYARKRDKQIWELLDKHDIPFKGYKDQVIFEKSEVVKDDGDPYVVYTPFMRKWKEEFKKSGYEHYPSEEYLQNCYEHSLLPNLALSDIGFEESAIKVPEFNLSRDLVANYEDTRNIPAKDGTSRLGPHLRFGTISVRQALKEALKPENETFWNELIWREFFMQILWHFPHTTNKAFKAKYDNIKWRNKEEEFDKWKAGETGYALVDAGMRELNESGYMHNRVRMLVASFLCKHLLIDWRWGEAYFAEKLLDYEMASNVGNWQWAAGSGVDAAPYFRIFNPITQLDKFDKQRTYVNHWVPEFGTEAYPEKMVDHKMARERCLDTYKTALN
ncbi:deoxyribodipyrimidine photo-lyase [Robiginitalea myxolifaciens]|uniref:Deoxyribodipyrimidine photo-lyase n=1 Tax=Robiginitalea myxolifaciens TaxID=400055 RepID=A0A1I6H135_9FLAO|nr:deoxyribodipyrimidine photo-lyase [Robiginitalea myxolifaciens]SFR48160.1 deoxyribodipyrimidine photo-lyase [Robiginitalea myxolifaciens]